MTDTRIASPKGILRHGPQLAELPHGALDAVAEGRHGDPFAVLGPHKIAQGLWEVRAMLPAARSASVVSADGATVLQVMERRHPNGFYVARFSSRERPDYRLRVDYGSQLPALLVDPYGFGSVLNDADVRALRDVGSDAPFRVLGAHPRKHEGVEGFAFAVWAPNASRVSVVGDFNGWDGRCHPMRLRHEGGVWELFIPGVEVGQHYKFELLGPNGNLLPLKADPMAFAAQLRPETASILTGTASHDWQDGEWMTRRAEGDPRKKPVSVYEVHLGSWARVPEEENRSLTYREMADKLIPYVKEMGFTHLELLPITEHPFDGSWGYQPTALFAPTSRFGTPQDFLHFVEAAHAAEIGIILDWVPGHFPIDAHGLGEFDGTHLYEHADPRQGFHQDWGTYIYNFGRAEVSAFLVANARFWAERYHLDGLRVDAVASMLYLDYSRKHGEWIPNRYGGNENLESIDFMRRMNETVYSVSPGVMTIAEESTSWPGVSHPTYAGGLGFGFKWNMGWMHDTLHYIQNDPIHRRYHHHDLTFGLLYAFSENFILPISHDEVVHGKGSLFDRMPGDEWQKFANLRAYLGFMWAHPGKKLLFMGCEIGQRKEWNFNSSVDWHLLEQPFHAGVKDLVRDLNVVYRDIPALHERDCEASGFEWLVSDDNDTSVIAWLRKGATDGDVVVAISNFTPIPREGYRIGVPHPGFYREVINTDAACYAGSNVGNSGGLHSSDSPSHGRPHSLSLNLPPLATVFLERRGS
jgi:1,4-alpha-glucan branching enzyme